jgi:formate hydrogenlyase subunit 4
MKHVLIPALAAFANLALVLLLAPLFDGVIRRITAVVQSRKGPPLLQSYFDLFKLLVKEDMVVGVSPLMQKLAAGFSFAAVLFISLLVPMGFAAPIGGWADVLLLVYMLTLLGISTLFAGLAAGTTYSLIGMNREMMSMITLEPLLAVSVIISAVHAGSFRLDAVFGGAVYASSIPVPVSGLLILGVIILSLQAFVGRAPFDATEAETEIMEGPLVEYSGPKLALFKYSRMMKLFVYCAIVIALFVPWKGTGVYPADLLIFVTEVLALVVLVTLVSAANARYRIDQAVRYYIVLFGIALAALIAAVLGW